MTNELKAAQEEIKTLRKENGKLQTFGRYQAFRAKMAYQVVERAVAVSNLATAVYSQDPKYWLAVTRKSMDEMREAIIEFETLVK